VPWPELPFCLYFQLIFTKAGTGKALKLPCPSPGIKMGSPGGYRYKAKSEGTISWATIRYAQKGVWVDG